MCKRFFFCTVLVREAGRNWILDALEKPCPKVREAKCKRSRDRGCKGEGREAHLSGDNAQRFMIQPPGSQHFSTEIDGDISTIAIPADSANPVTVLSIRIQQEKEVSTTEVICDGHQLALNFAKDYPIDFPYHLCLDDVVINKTGNDVAFVSIVFLPFNINESTGSIVLTPSPVTLLSSFTFGELTIALILIPLALVVLYQTIVQVFRKPIVWHK